MKVGVNVVNYGSGTSPATLKRWATFAEQIGYHAVMISDHVALTPDVSSEYGPPLYDTFLALAWLAAMTRTVQLGTTVAILPYRHPLITARLAANLDQLSDGRLILGVGAGWARQEFEALGIPFEQRGPITNEYLEIIRNYFTHDHLSWHGTFASFNDVQTGPRPVQSPHPPIWVGSETDSGIRRAARLGDAWHPHSASIKSLRDDGLPLLERVADEAGRARPALCPRIDIIITDNRLPDDGRALGCGTIDQVRRDLEELVALGASYLIVDTSALSPGAPLELDAHLAILDTLQAKALDLRHETVR